MERRIDALKRELEAERDRRHMQEEEWRQCVETELDGLRQGMNVAPKRRETRDPLLPQPAAAPAAPEPRPPPQPERLRDLAFNIAEVGQHPTSGSEAPPPANAQPIPKMWQKLNREAAKMVAEGLLRGKGDVAARGPGFEGVRTRSPRRTARVRGATQEDAAEGGPKEKGQKRPMAERLTEEFLKLRAAKDSDSASSEFARPRAVRMMRWDTESAAERARGLNSLVYNVLASRSAPLFSGEETDWQEFSREWAEYVSLLKESEGGALPDVFLFDLLRMCVDPATRNRLRTERHRELCQVLPNPGEGIHA